MQKASDCRTFDLILLQPSYLVAKVNEHVLAHRGLYHRFAIHVTRMVQIDEQTIDRFWPFFTLRVYVILYNVRTYPGGKISPLSRPASAQMRANPD